jgi:hypothetical protein
MLTLNKKALSIIAVIALITAGSGAYAYSNSFTINDADVQIGASNVTIDNSNVTLGQNNTITYPDATPTPEPSATPKPTATPTPTQVPVQPTPAPTATPTPVPVYIPINITYWESANRTVTGLTTTITLKLSVRNYINSTECPVCNYTFTYGKFYLESPTGSLLAYDTYNPQSTIFSYPYSWGTFTLKFNIIGSFSSYILRYDDSYVTFNYTQSVPPVYSNP